MCSFPDFCFAFLTKIIGLLILLHAAYLQPVLPAKYQSELVLLLECTEKPLLAASFLQVVSVFKAESKPAADDEAESNSVESLGFCNV